MTDPLEPSPIEQTDLPNGLRIVTETMPEARSVTLGAWVRVGGRDEPDELSGASHFLEHLLFKGTEARSAREIAEAVDSVGGEMNAFTAREHTAYYARLPHQQLELGVGLLGDVLTAPALRPAEVEAERQVIVEEILMNLDAPEDRAHTLLAEALFADHPLGRDVLGEMATVEALGRDDIAGFFRRWYRPGHDGARRGRRLEHAARRRPRRGGLRPGSTAAQLPEREAPVADRADGGGGARTTPSRPTCASAGAALDVERRRPLGHGRGQPGARRGHGQPPVPGGAGGAGPRLRRVLPPERVQRQRLPHDLLRHRAEAGPRDAAR